jgi:stage II sporulation protein D
MNLIAALALMFVVSVTGREPDSIRISLFSLFRPELVEVRAASVDGATLTISGVSSPRCISRNESIRIRLSGSRLEVFSTGLSSSAEQSISTSEVRIAPAGSGTLELTLPHRISRIVRGEVAIDAGAGGHGPLRILLKTDREAAVASIVNAETSDHHPEALKALAIVVRTFMLSHSGRHSNEGFDFCDTTHCQFYSGERVAPDRLASNVVINAVAHTRGQYLAFNGRLVEGYYTASCGGISATPSMVWGGETRYPYKPVACQWCRGSRFYKWERAAAAERILDALSMFTGAKLSSATELITVNDPSSGLARAVAVRDRGRKISLTADEFRRAIGLKLGWNTVLSPTFTIERRGLQFIFRGRGFGSQVGLCEAGAIAQAAAGRGYREILSFYFPETEISNHFANE